MGFNSGFKGLKISGYFHYIFSWKWSFQAYCGSRMGIMWGNNSFRNSASNCLYGWFFRSEK